MTQGQIIQTERIKRLMTQEELGKILGVRREAIGKLEIGNTHLTKKNLAVLSNLWGIDAEILANGNDEPYIDPRRDSKGVLLSRKRANNKYQANHYDCFKLRFALGERDDLQEISKEMGYDSFHQFCIDAIKEKAGVL